MGWRRHVPTDEESSYGKSKVAVRWKKKEKTEQRGLWNKSAKRKHDTCPETAAVQRAFNGGVKE